METLTRDHKIAVARLITDLIEADFIVEADEMKLFEYMISKEVYAISETMLAESKKLDFAKALSTLRDLDYFHRVMIVDTLKKMSISDGVCVPLEAIFIFAVEQVLLHGAKIHSIPCLQSNIDNLKVIYIENEESDITRQVEDNLLSISNVFKMAGFDFIYIPSLVNDFRMMDEDYLKKVIKYMIPSISQERICEICDNLRGLTTAKFCRDLLYKKLGLKLIDSKPSLLIKINDSDIIDKYDSEETEKIRFSNYLQIELNDNTLNNIHNIVESYYSMISCSITIENKPHIAKFVYSGFHRSLFDLIAFGRKTEDYRLVIDIKGHCASVYFESVDNSDDRIFLKLNPQETALYYMIVRKSLEGKGLDWREHIPAKDKKIILDEYNKVYSEIGKANFVSEYKDRTQVHHIKNRIRLIHSMANAEMFIPEHVKDGNASYYRIKANDSYVTIKTNTTL